MSARHSKRMRRLRKRRNQTRVRLMARLYLPTPLPCSVPRVASIGSMLQLRNASSMPSGVAVAAIGIDHRRTVQCVAAQSANQQNHTDAEINSTVAIGKVNNCATYYTYTSRKIRLFTPSHGIREACVDEFSICETAHTLKLHTKTADRALSSSF